MNDKNDGKKVEDYIIEGRNPVLEALDSGRDINKLMVVNGNKEGSIKKIIAKAKDKGIIISYVDRQKINGLSKSDNHQGVLAFVATHEYVELEDLLNAVQEKEESP